MGQALFVLKQKGPKNSSQQKCFFALKAFALQNGQNLGCDYFAPSILPQLQKLPMPCRRTTPHCFARFRSKLFC
jgi:hypothetical protein